MQNKFEDTAINERKMVDYLTGQKMTFNYDGSSKSYRGCSQLLHSFYGNIIYHAGAACGGHESGGRLRSPETDLILSV